jgi:transposase
MQEAAMPEAPQPTRYIGLDIHRDYFVAAGVDPGQATVLNPQRVENARLESWIKKQLTPTDAVVLEVTTNTYAFYDALAPHVQSVTVVHPPHVALITRAQVKTDQKAAMAMAQLLAAGLLVSIWIPPQPIRDARAVVAQRFKMVRLQTQAKNRLRAVLHRHHLAAPEKPFSPDQRAWWEQLDLSVLEKVNIQCDLDTLASAHQQIERLEACLGELAAKDPRVPLLVQVTGIGLIAAMTLLSAIGEIKRFADATHLVGYAGLGARVHASGLTYQTGRITKTGRKDIRHVMVEAAQNAARFHPHWKEEYARLEPRLGKNKAKVAIARKLLVVVWHVLSEEQVDRYADPQQVACSFFAHAYKVGVKNLPEGQTALQYTRNQLDRLGIGADLKTIPWGSKKVKLPPSRLA